MLILTRREAECVYLIDRDTGEVVATVKVLSVTPFGVVRLGFDAPDSIQILRDNIKDMTHEQITDDDTE